MLPVKKHLEAPPSSTGEFRYLLGLVGYFRRHVANFDKIAKPYMISPRSQISKVNSYHHLQQILGSSSSRRTRKNDSSNNRTPILAFPDIELSFVAHVDASGKELG